MCFGCEDTINKIHIFNTSSSISLLSHNVEAKWRNRRFEAQAGLIHSVFERHAEPAAVRSQTSADFNLNVMGSRNTNAPFNFCGRSQGSPLVVGGTSVRSPWVAVVIVAFVWQVGRAGHAHYVILFLQFICNVMADASQCLLFTVADQRDSKKCMKATESSSGTRDNCSG